LRPSELAADVFDAAETAAVINAVLWPAGDYVFQLMMTDNPRMKSRALKSAPRDKINDASASDANDGSDRTCPPNRSVTADSEAGHRGVDPGILHGRSVGSVRRKTDPSLGRPIPAAERCLALFLAPRPLVTAAPECPARCDEDIVQGATDLRWALTLA
jgi:hypothetical protein